MHNIIKILATNNGATNAKQGVSSVNTGGNSTDLTGSVGTIINMIIFLIGIAAVIMVIIGGISYTMSQGDPSKTKKAKDTILYGIIGLIVALLAFAIVQFVLTQLGG